MAILVFGFLARAAVGPAEYPAQHARRPDRRSRKWPSAAALLNVGLNLVLIPRFGMVGAAAATAGALVFAATANAIVARRRLGVSIFILAHLGRTR